MNKMKAVVINDYNELMELKEVSQPKLLDDSVLIEVHGASVNPVDGIVQAGYLKDFMPISFPYVMGYDVSGVVVQVGKDVTKFKAGDEVFSRPNGLQAGTLAEFCVVKEEELAIKPSNISHPQAATIPLVGLTALQALTSKGGLKQGEKVLIHAGSGGVGTLAIQIAKHLGAEVATTTSTTNVDLVKSLGADVVIDYKTQNFEDELNDYDLVIDMMGGEALDKSFQVLKKGGRLISIKGQDTNGLAEKYGVHFDWFFMWPSGEQLTELAQMITDGKLKPVVDKTFTLDDFNSAYEHLATGRTKGKIAIAVK